MKKRTQLKNGGMVMIALALTLVLALLSACQAGGPQIGASKKERFLTRRGVPEPDSQILTRRSQPLSIWAKRNAEDRLRVSLQSDGFLSGRGVPHAHLPAVMSRRDLFTVWAERHLQRIAHFFQYERLLTTRGVPDSHRAISASRYDPFPVRAKCHARNQAGVACQC